MTPEEREAALDWVIHNVIGYRRHGPTIRAIFFVVWLIASIIGAFGTLIAAADPQIQVEGWWLYDATLAGIYPVFGVAALALMGTNKAVLRMRGKHKELELEKLRTRTAELERELGV